MISVIILTWNSERYITRCLDPLKEKAGEGELALIVIDNGSQDETLKILGEYAQHITLIRNPHNFGVAKARNQGLKLVQSEYAVLLDVDTLPSVSVLMRLRRFMDANPDVGVCAPNLIYPDGTPQHGCRRFPLVYTKVLRRIDTGWAVRLLKEERYEDETAGSVPFDADYVLGACQMIRRSAIDDVGYLDERIFYGPEDMDYCLRMWMHGWRVVCLPDVFMVHDVQRITKKRFFSLITLRHFVALVYFFCKHRYFFFRKRLYSKIDRSSQNALVKTLKKV